jgi:hypothetical protein
MKTYLLFITAFLLISCGEKRPKSLLGAETVQMNLLSDLSYELRGVDSQDFSCTTGLKKFRTLHEMCLELQRPVDYECALEQKQSLFSQRCVPAGYKYRESVECEARLVEVNVHTNLASDNIVGSKKICVGVTKGQVNKETYKHEKGELSHGVNYDMELNKDKNTIGTILITDTTNNEPKELKLEYKGSDVQLRDETSDKRLMVELTCQRTWSCGE